MGKLWIRKLHACPPYGSTIGFTNWFMLCRSNFRVETEDLFKNWLWEIDRIAD